MLSIGLYIKRNQRRQSPLIVIIKNNLYIINEKPIADTFGVKLHQFCEGK